MRPVKTGGAETSEGNCEEEWMVFVLPSVEFRVLLNGPYKPKVKWKFWEDREVLRGMGGRDRPEVRGGRCEEALWAFSVLSLGPA